MKKLTTTILIFFSLFFTILISGAACAATINVNPGENAIKNAVTSAQAGDMLNLSAGTYNEHDLSVDKNLTITGPDASATPTAIIDAQNLGRVFNINSGITVSLKYLTIQNGNAGLDTDTQKGGGIQNNGNLIIEVCNINTNSAEDGGGIYNAGTMAVISSTINGNTANYGGGINSEGIIMTVTSSSINGNTANYYGGGLYINGLTLSGSFINENTASFGGGIYHNGGKLSIENSYIQNNSVTSNGGGIYNSHGTLDIISSNINQNTAKNGGGIYNSETITVAGSNINSNTAINGDGGGIYNYLGTLSLTGSTIDENTAVNGGGICNHSNLTVTGCDFQSNDATANGNAIYNSNGDASNRIVHFNRFQNTSSGWEIYCAYGAVDALYNWWGSNETPTGKVIGSVNITPWLILTLEANPTIIGKNSTSQIDANLCYDSNGDYHNLDDGPDNIPVYFTTSIGNINSTVSTVNGSAIATLTSGNTTGSAYITAIMDDQIIHTTVSIETTTLTAIIIASGNVKEYYETHHSIPSTVTIDGHEVSIAQFLHLQVTTTINISEGILNPINIIAVNPAPSPSGTYTSGKLTKSEYLKVAQNIKKFINSNGRAPNYAATSLGKIPFKKLIYMYAKIINFFGNNNRLPNYVII